MITVRLPDGRMIKTNAANGADAQAAAKRFLANEDAQKRYASTPAQVRAVSNGATLSGANWLDAGSAAAETGLHNLFDPGHAKYGMADAFQAVRQINHDQDAKFAGEHPGQALGLGLLGGLLMPGGAGLAKLAASPAKGLLGLLGGTVRSAGVGAALGGANGALAAQPGHELDGAGQGAETGAFLGGIAPSAAGAVGATAKLGSRFVTGATRLANNATGGAVASVLPAMNPQRVAGQKLAAAMKADGLDQTTARQVLNGWLKSDVSPALLDLVPQGGRTQALLRDAAAKAPAARRVMQSYAADTTAATQPNAVRLSNKLTPNESRPAPIVQSDLIAQRQADAKTGYRAPYNQVVPTDPVMDALGGQDIAPVFRAATKSAGISRDWPQRDELSAISGAANPPAQPLPAGAENLGPAAQAQVMAQIAPKAPLPPEVTLGALDQLKQKLNDMGKAAAAKPETARDAAGYFARAKEIDDHLASVSPDYAQARDKFADTSRSIDAVDQGRQGLTQPASEYSGGLAALMQGATTPEASQAAQGAAGVGLRQQAVDSINAQPRGSLSAIDRLASAPDVGSNLTSTFGPEAAGNYRDGLRLLSQKQQTADALSPGGVISDTAGSGVPHSLLPHVLVPALIAKIAQGGVLNNAEREAVSQIGTMKAPDALRTVSQSPSISDRFDQLVDRLTTAASATAPVIAAPQASRSMMGQDNGVRPEPREQTPLEITVPAPGYTWDRNQGAWVQSPPARP